MWCGVLCYDVVWSLFGFPWFSWVPKPWVPKLLERRICYGFGKADFVEPPCRHPVLPAEGVTCFFQCFSTAWRMCTGLHSAGDGFWCSCCWLVGCCRGAGRRVCWVLCQWVATGIVFMFMVQVLVLAGFSWLWVSMGIAFMFMVQFLVLLGFMPVGFHRQCVHVMLIAMVQLVAVLCLRHPTEPCCPCCVATHVCVVTRCWQDCNMSSMAVVWLVYLCS